MKWILKNVLVFLIILLIVAAVFSLAYALFIHMEQVQAELCV